MPGYVYLIRIGDLYRIGKANNIEKKIKKLKPDELVASILTKEPETLEARLLRKFKSQRIPETGYLKLTKKQLSECKLQFELKGNVPHTLEAKVSITLFASFILFFISFLALNYFRIGFLTSTAYSFFVSSIPMLILSINGSFGGYFDEDLKLFSSFTNSIKAIFIAVALLTISYLFFQVT